MTLNDRLSLETVAPGDVLPETRVTISPETYSEYNQLVNEMNPLHFDKPYAQKLGYRDIVVAGVYTFSFIPQMIENWAGSAGHINTIDIRYHNPVYIGETIVLTAQVTEKNTMNDQPFVTLEIRVKDTFDELLTVAMMTVTF